MAKTFPISTDTGERFVAASVAPKMSYEDGHATDVQATDRDGRPLWRVSVFVMDADTTRAPETISVTVPAAVAPALAQLAPVVFHGLRVLIWSGGASLRADSVEPLTDAAPASSAFLSDIEEA